MHQPRASAFAHLGDLLADDMAEHRLVAENGLLVQETDLRALIKLQPDGHFYFDDREEAFCLAAPSRTATPSL